MIERLDSATLWRSLPFYHAFREEVARPYPHLFREGPEGQRHYIKAWTSLFELGLGVIFFVEGAGILLATVTEDLFDGAVVATEHAWFVMPEARGGRTGAELLDAFEAWAKERGAARAVLSHFIEGMPNLDRYFAHRGFFPLEKHYLKAL